MITVYKLQEEPPVDNDDWGLDDDLDCPARGTRSRIVNAVNGDQS